MRKLQFLLAFCLILIAGSVNANTARHSLGVGVVVQVNPEDVDGFNSALRTAKREMGVDWMHYTVYWSDVEATKGTYDWDALDEVMIGSVVWGIKPVLRVISAPDWAREAGVSTATHGPAANNTDYVNFVQAILHRYPGQVYGIEVWSEQNISREWTSLQGLSESIYVSLLRDTYNMVQELSPETIVISGALAPTGLDDGIIAKDDFRYMYRMIEAGLLDVVDCVGMKHYGFNVGADVSYDYVPNDETARFRGPFDNPHHSWVFYSTWQGYRARIKNAGYETPICVTEFGWGSAEDLDSVPRGFEFVLDNTLEEQAQWITDALTLMAESGDVRLAMVNNLNAGVLNDWDTENADVLYSLIGPDNTFRPAIAAIGEWQRQWNQDR